MCPSEHGHKVVADRAEWLMYRQAGVCKHSLVPGENHQLDIALRGERGDGGRE